MLNSICSSWRAVCETPLKLEGLLTDAGIDYLVETGTYTGGLLFKRDLAGAFFYVMPGDLSRGKDILSANRIKA